MTVEDVLYGEDFIKTQQPGKQVVSKSLYEATNKLKREAIAQTKILREAIGGALTLLDSDPESAKMVLEQIYAATQPVAISTKEDCGCRDKNAKQQ